MALQQGQSGNPEGRRKGVKTNATKLKEVMSSAVDTLIDAVKAGDAAAAILDRVWPVGSAT